MSTVTKLGITLDKGRVVQKNFNNYDPIRIDEMPVVEVHIVPSHENPGGIGEASTPCDRPGGGERGVRRDEEARADAAD